MKLVLFDFDKTLTFTDTLLPLSYYLCKCSGTKIRYFKILYYYLLFRSSIIDEMTLKKNFCKLLVNNRKVDEINNIVKEFFTIHSAKLFNPVLTEILKSQYKNGNHCYIISSNFSYFLNPLKEFLPVYGIESTFAAVKNGIYTGFIEGINCSKSEKWNRAEQCKIKFNYDEIIAYGDSRGDYEMLKGADKGFWVKSKLKDKSKKIKAILYYLIGKVYIPECETQIISFTG